MTRLLPLALLGCTAPSGNPLPPPLAPTVPMELTVSPLVSGERVDIRVTAAPPRSTVTLYRSNGEVGPGDCPSYLGGECFDMEPGSGYRETLTARADAWGTAWWTVPSLPLVPGTELSVQAAAITGSTVQVSNAVGLRVGGCLVDAFEPNDSMPNATNLSTGGFTDLAVCGNERDRFVIDVPAGQAVVVVVEHGLTSRDLIVSEYPEDTAVRYVQGEVSMQWLNDTGSDSTFRFRVEDPRSDAPESRIYDLDVQVVTPGGGCADVDEPNDSEAQAIDLSGSGRAAGVMCGDDDWYRMDIPAGYSLDITRSTDAVGPVYMELITADGAEQVEDLQSSRVVSGDEVWMRVGAYAGEDPYGVGIDYDFSLDLVPFPLCVDDGLGDNGDPSGAVELPADVVAGVACAGEEDWFELSLETQDLLTLSVQGGVRLELIDPGGDVAYGLTDEGGSYSVTSTGLHQVRVVRTVPAQDESYILEWSVDPVSDCPVDVFEPNDSSATATPIDAGVFSAEGCINDSDWYAIEVTSPEILEYSLQYNWRMGAQQATLRGSPPGGGAIAHRMVARDPGTYLLHVDTTVDDGGGIPYTLTLTRTPMEACLPDTLEPNDSLAEGALLLPNTVHTVQECGVDEDWFELPSGAGTDLWVDVDYDIAGGDQRLGMSLFTHTGARLRNAVDVGHTGHLEVGRDGSDQSFFLHVYTVADLDDGGIAYTVDYRVTGP